MICLHTRRFFGPGNIWTSSPKIILMPDIPCQLGGFLFFYPTQNRCGWCLFAYGEYKLDLLFIGQLFGCRVQPARRAAKTRAPNSPKNGRRCWLLVKSAMKEDWVKSHPRLSLVNAHRKNLQSAPVSAFLKSREGHKITYSFSPALVLKKGQTKKNLPRTVQVAIKKFFKPNPAWNL